MASRESHDDPLPVVKELQIHQHRELQGLQGLEGSHNTPLHSTPQSHTTINATCTTLFYSPRCNKNTTPLSPPSLPPPSKPHQDLPQIAAQHKHETQHTQTHPDRNHQHATEGTRFLPEATTNSCTPLSLALSNTLSPQLQPRRSPHRKQTSVDTTSLLLSPSPPDYLLRSVFELTPPRLPTSITRSSGHQMRGREGLWDPHGMASSSTPTMTMMLLRSMLRWCSGVVLLCGRALCFCASYGAPGTLYSPIATLLVCLPPCAGRVGSAGRVRWARVGGRPGNLGGRWDVSRPPLSCSGVAVVSPSMSLGASFVPMGNAPVGNAGKPYPKPPVKTRGIIINWD